MGACASFLNPSVLPPLELLDRQSQSKDHGGFKALFLAGGNEWRATYRAFVVGETKIVAFVLA
jgi:hypothetical protein